MYRNEIGNIPLLKFRKSHLAKFIKYHYIRVFKIENLLIYIVD